MKKTKRNKARVLDFRYFLYDFGRITGVIPGLIWLRPKWVYESKAARKRLRGSAILMINHTGFIDPILAQFAVWYRRQHFVATKELFEGKVKNWLFNVFHCIEIDRSNFNYSSFRSITDHLEDGKIVTIYPEGHINFESESVAAFKSGIVMMALRSGRPIVPIYIKPPKTIWNRAVFVIGEPIDLRGTYGALPSIDTINKISEDLRKKEIELGELIK